MPRWTCLPLLLSFTALGCDQGPDRLLSPEANTPALSIDTNSSTAQDADRNGNGWICGGIGLLDGQNGPGYHDDKPDGSCPGGLTLQPVDG